MEQTYISDTESFLRKSISEEELAVSVYIDRKTVALRYAEACRELDNEELAVKFETIAYTLQDILEEEQVHIGQFREMLTLLDVSNNKEKEGTEEARKDIQKFESFTGIANKMRKYIKE